MHFPEVAYLRWAKTHPPARINMARSGVDACPPSALGLTSRDLVVTLPVHDGYMPLREAIARRYRRFDEGYAIDIDRFASLVNRRTRLAVVSNLHNPSGARIDLAMLRRMAAILRRVGAFLVVDEVYLECLWGARTESCVHAGPNVITTSSLTKAYGLDGLRA